jgi:hypothetical protein
MEIPAPEPEQPPENSFSPYHVPFMIEQQKRYHQPHLSAPEKKAIVDLAVIRLSHVEGGSWTHERVRKWFNNQQRSVGANPPELRADPPDPRPVEPVAAVPASPSGRVARFVSPAPTIHHNPFPPTPPPASASLPRPVSQALLPPAPSPPRPRAVTTADSDITWRVVPPGPPWPSRVSKAEFSLASHQEAFIQSAATLIATANLPTSFATGVPFARFSQQNCPPPVPLSEWQVRAAIVSQANAIRERLTPESQGGRFC